MLSLATTLSSTLHLRCFLYRRRPTSAAHSALHLAHHGVLSGGHGVGCADQPLRVAGDSRTEPRTEPGGAVHVQSCEPCGEFRV